MALPGMLLGGAAWGSAAFYGGRDLFGLKAGTAMLAGVTAGGALLGVGGGTDSGWGTGARAGSAIGMVGGAGAYVGANWSNLTKAVDKGKEGYVRRRWGYQIGEIHEAGTAIVNERLGEVEAKRAVAEMEMDIAQNMGAQVPLSGDFNEVAAADRKVIMGEYDQFKTSIKPQGRVGKAVKANITKTEFEAMGRAGTRELFTHVAQPKFYKGALKWSGAAGLAGLAIGGVIGGMAGHKRTVTSNQPMY